MLKNFFCLFIMAFSLDAFSANQDVEITGVGVSENTKTVYITVTPNISGTVCGKKYQVRIAIDSLVAKEVYSAALTALASSKTVSLGYDSSSSARCLYNNPIIETFYIKK